MGLIFKKSTAQPAFTVAAAITGTAQVGQTLTCAYTVLRARSQNVTVRWYRHTAGDGTAPNGTLVGTGSTYVVNGDDALGYLRCTVDAFNPAGAVQSVSSYTSQVSSLSPVTPPTDIYLSATSIADSASVGAVVATISSNGDSPITFTEQADPDAKFTVSGNQLQLAAGLDYGTATSHSVTIRATNSGGFVDEAFTINVLNSAGDFVVLPEMQLDDGAVGWNAGEYVVCDFEVTSGTPSVQWFYFTNPADIDGTKTNISAGAVAPSPLLPVSAPNGYRAAYFLDTTTFGGANAGTRYIGCDVTIGGTTQRATYTAAAIANIVGTPISAASLYESGAKPTYLSGANTTYYLTEDITTDGTAFIMNAANQTLNLNGYTITFDDAASVTPSNTGFESGATGWNFANANTNGGANDVGDADYCSIYTAASYGAGYNAKKLNTGVSSLEFTQAAMADNGVYRYVVHTSSITLEPGAWYTISFMGYRGGSKGYLFARLRESTDGVVATATTAANYSYNRGIQYVEQIFRAQHTTATYTLEVGVLGETGATGAGWIDDVKISRTRTCGVFFAINDSENSTRLSTVTISNAGSGYVDGSYTGVSAVRVSGGVPKTLPKFNITVSGGVVTEATLSSYGEFILPDTVYTVAAASLGGTGSGLLLATNKLWTYYPTGSAVYVKNLEQRTSYNSSSGSTVKNGSVVQGADGGTFARCIGLNTWGYKLHRLTCVASGENSNIVGSYYNYGRTTTIADCHFTHNSVVSGNRDNNWGATTYWIAGTYKRNTILNSTIHATFPGDSASVPVTYYGNTFRSKVIWTNGRSIHLYVNGSTAYDNIVDNTGDYYGRCVAISAGTARSVSLHHNTIKGRPMPYNSEGAFFMDYVLQVEGFVSGATADIYNNEIVAEAASGKSAAIRLLDMDLGSAVNIYNNAITATASGSGYAAIAYNGAGSQFPQYAIAGDVLWYNNTLTTNSVLMWCAEDELSVLRDNAINIETVSGNERRIFVGGYTESAAKDIDVRFRDCTYGTGALAAIAADRVWLEPAYGTGSVPASRGGYTVEWTLTVATGVPSIAVTITDKNGGTTYSGTADGTGNYVVRLPQYYVRGAGVEDWNAAGTSQTGWTWRYGAGAATAVTIDSAKTVSY